MKVGRLPTLAYLVIGAFVLVGMPSPALAQTAQHQQHGQDQKSQAGALVRVVREATARFRDVSQAEAEGHSLQFGCVSGPDSGAMGMHYVNFPKVLDGELDAEDPEIVIYEPTSNGRLKLIGADYLVLAEAWDAKGIGPPHGTASSSVREPQSLRAAGVLHAACVGVEGQSHRHVRELALQGFV